MKYHFDSKIVLYDHSETPNLYKWSLNEVGESTARLRTGQIPWHSNLWFRLSDVELHTGIRLDPYSVPDGGAAQVLSRELIRAKLSPGSRMGGDRVVYSMFGTTRSIEDIALTIEPTPEGVEEHCRAWGVVSYTTDHDFRDETIDDCFGFNLYVSPDRFSLVATRVAAGAIGDGVLRVSGVSGFYSEWSPSISTSSVKVLTDSDSHPVEMPEGCKIISPRLETVREFDLSLWSETIRPTGKAGRLEVEDDDDHGLAIHRPQAGPSPAAVNALPVLKSLRLASWIIVALLVVLVFK